MAKILDGKKISGEIREELRERVKKLEARSRTPTMVGILVGEDPGSASYIRLKEKGCEQVGICPVMLRLPADTSQEKMLEEIGKLNEDPDIHGIFIQLPLPNHIDEALVLNAVLPEKDVDGFHPLNVGRAWLGQEAFLPATPIGIYELLKRSGYGVEKKEVTIVNVDSLVGKPLASILVKEGANVTLCQPSSPRLRELTKRADIVVVSVNSPKFITTDMVEEGAIVIDFGFNYIDGKSVGDVDFDAVKEKAGAITPVPGGVGPMTVTMLLANTIKACEMALGSQE